MNILLGMTGSVATTIAPRIVAAMEGVLNASDVKVIMTPSACMFYEAHSLQRRSSVKVLTEKDEWAWETGLKTEHVYDDGHRVVLPKPEPVITDRWEKGFPILHIELAKNSSVLVVAPASANTIAKMANGIADNLLTSVFLAWNTTRPVIVAPSMNTRMWTSKVTQRNIHTLLEMGVVIVPPIFKTLACGDVGEGAMAMTEDITRAVNNNLRWRLPIIPSHGVLKIPVGNHPGSFGAVRKHDRHCGVDLYCLDGDPVEAVEDGEVVAVEDFTGSKAGCGWWLDTMAVKVEGASGVVCYGEIQPCSDIKVGKIIGQGEMIGTVTPVLPPHKLRTDIPCHSCSMLHLQLYKHGVLHKQNRDWGLSSEMPEEVLDPTPYLMSAYGDNRQTIDMGISPVERT